MLNVIVLSKQALRVTMSSDKYLLKQALDVFRPDLDPFDERFHVYTRCNNPTFEVRANKSALEGNGGWHRVLGTTDFIDPYWALLEKRVGAGRFNVNLSEAVRGIYHTHIFETLSGTGQFCIVKQIWAYQGEWLMDDQNDEPVGRTSRGRYFQSVAEQQALRIAQKTLGREDSVPEYIPIGSDGGLFKRNPNYGTGRQAPIRPGVYNEKVWNLLWQTWVDRFATEGQRAMLARFATVYGRDLKIPSIHSDYDGFHTDNYKTHVTWEEFKAL